jgi:hypothetical protein
MSSSVNSKRVTLVFGSGVTPATSKNKSDPYALVVAETTEMPKELACVVISYLPKFGRLTTGLRNDRVKILILNCMNGIDLIRMSCVNKTAALIIQQSPFLLNKKMDAHRRPLAKIGTQIFCRGFQKF